MTQTQSRTYGYEDLLKYAGNKRGRRRVTRREEINQLSDTKPLKLGDFINPLGISVIIITCVLLLLIGGVFFLTMGLYADIGANFAQQQGYYYQGDLGAIYVKDWFVIGWPLHWLLRLFAWGISTIEVSLWTITFMGLFTLLQTAEIAPTLFYNSRRLMKLTIDSFSGHKKYTIKRTDSAPIQKLMKEHNAFYEHFLDWLDYSRWFAFAIDALICFGLVAIIAGDPPKLLFDAWNELSFSSDDILWLNVVRISCSLCLINILVLFYMKVIRLYTIFRSVKRNASRT